MRTKQFIALAGLAALASGGGTLRAEPGLRAPAAAVENAAAASDAASLVGQLSHEDFGTREAATRKLWDMGTAALPALNNIADGKDPEAADRARELLLYIGAGVLPDSPDEIKTMVIQFSRSGEDKKLAILRKLTGMGQWRQVLHLARMEKDPSTRRKMAAIVRQNAGSAARKAIVAGDHRLAAEVLELIGDSDQALVMRAWYHRQRGQLAAELQAAAQMPGRNGIRWRLALHRADGNTRGALKEAKALGDARLVAALQLHQGDAVPWLLADVSAKGRLDPILEISRRIQIARLRGEEKKAGILARELAQMAGDAMFTLRVIPALAGNGYRSLALDVMARGEPLTVFSYFDNIEAPKKALGFLGIPPDASAPYTEWVRKTTAEALEDEEHSTYNKLIMLASFLARHGEQRHALAVVKPLMDALEKNGSDAWFELIYRMVLYDLGKEALHLVELRGNKDAEADKAVKNIFRKHISGDSVVHLWEALKKRNGGKLGESLRQIGILSGITGDENNEIPALEKQLSAEAKEDKDVDQAARFAALFAFADIRGDMETCLAMSKSKAPRDDTWLKAKRYYEKELFHWPQTEAYYRAKAKEDPGDYRSAAYLYIALRKQGKDGKTKGMFERLLLLSMGDAGVLGALAGEFYTVGYYKEATDLWKQALLMAEPGDRHFDSAIEALSEFPQHLYDSGQWKLAAAVTEAHIQLLYRGGGNVSINDMLRARFRAGLARGMDQLRDGKRSQAIATLDAARRLVPGDGTLADHFFPLLRKAAVGPTYDQWFAESYRHIAKASALYPGSHNTHNTAAWLCSRAVRKLDAAEAHAAEALKARPHQGAYLDTMAEVWFARGDRAKALDWSRKAVTSSTRHPQGVFRQRRYVIQNIQQLQLQLNRFEHAPPPN